MGVILFVAGETIRWGAFKKAVYMTIFAGNTDVSWRKFEDRLVVIKFDGFPTLRRMT
jgi:hypothetical protein